MVGVPFGLNDRGYKAQVRNLLRTDTPMEATSADVAEVMWPTT